MAVSIVDKSFQGDMPGLISEVLRYTEFFDRLNLSSSDRADILQMLVTEFNKLAHTAFTVEDAVRAIKDIAPHSQFVDL